jgi:hypothetical protein
VTEAEGRLGVQKHKRRNTFVTGQASARTSRGHATGLMQYGDGWRIPDTSCQVRPGSGTEADAEVSRYRGEEEQEGGTLRVLREPGHPKWAEG